MLPLIVGSGSEADIAEETLPSVDLLEAEDVTPEALDKPTPAN